MSGNFSELLKNPLIKLESPAFLLCFPLVLANEKIITYAGHEDFATTQKYYAYPTNSMEKRSNVYEKANQLQPITPVTKSKGNLSIYQGFPHF